MVRCKRWIYKMDSLGGFPCLQKCSPRMGGYCPECRDLFRWSRKIDAAIRRKETWHRHVFRLKPSRIKTEYRRRNR